MMRLMCISLALFISTVSRIKNNYCQMHLVLWNYRDIFYSIWLSLTVIALIRTSVFSAWFCSIAVYREIHVLFVGWSTPDSNVQWLCLSLTVFHEQTIIQFPNLTPRKTIFSGIKMFSSAYTLCNLFSV